MKLLDERNDDFVWQLDEMLKRQTPDREPDVERAVSEIIEDVRTEGDEALFKYARKLDKADIDSSNVAVSEDEFKAALTKVPPKIFAALERAHERIKSFHLRQLEHFSTGGFQYKDALGVELGMKVEPLDRVGLYVPGGKAAYPSSVLMSAVPAKVAGVREVVMVSLQRSDFFHPNLLAAAKIAGVEKVFRVGGAQAIAALAYGTDTIPRVDKIVGPGNAYVSCAKRLVYGVVDIDMIAGPSEILVISDGSANPAFIAADLLSQAEHDESSRAIFITTSEWEAHEVIEEVNSQLENLDRKKIAKQSIEDNGAVLLVGSLERAAEIANMFAPEHLEILCVHHHAVLSRIKNAGAIFLGRYTPEALGDYMAGPNHILPTGGSARFRGPLGVYDFFRRSSVIEASKKAFMELAKDVIEIARAEELGAHAHSVSIRAAKEKPKSEK